MCPGISPPRWALPFEAATSDDPKRRRTASVLRVVAWTVLAAALLAPAIQFEYGVIRNQRRAEAYQRKAQAGTLTDAEKRKGPPKPHKGAINRWRTAVYGLWGGENIYLTPDEYVRQRREQGLPLDLDSTGVLHPNMPFVVILLTPLAYLPTWAGMLAFNGLKLLVLASALLASARLVDHKDHRMPDWVLGLGVLWWLVLPISDIQHGNTNVFVLGAIVLHLWLYRRGRDGLAGAALALAICLKMTPALFGLYWLYQRNWKLLAGCVLAGVIFAAIVPGALLGPTHAVELTRTWLDNLIFKGLGGEWYPVHVNQSLPAVIGRYLLDGQPGGNILWSSDDNPYNLQTKFEWIAPVSLSPDTVRHIIRIAQLAVVAIMAAAIGWRKLDRDDGRRGLHYAMVLGGILLLNQRTWDHHAAILLPATLAIWYALAFGRMSRGLRWTALVMMLLAGATLWLSSGDLVIVYGRLAGLSKCQAVDFSNRFEAYGPTFGFFLLTFLTATLLALALQKNDEPYAKTRQPLRLTTSG